MGEAGLNQRRRRGRVSVTVMGFTRSTHHGIRRPFKQESGHQDAIFGHILHINKFWSRGR
jgi:hypothetical protein